MTAKNPYAGLVCIRCGHNESSHYLSVVLGCRARINGVNCRCLGFKQAFDITKPKVRK